jgi:hypothetical protein
LPKKLLVLVVWMTIGAIATVVQTLLGGMSSGWFSVAVSALLILGVLKGSEGVRMWLMFGAVVGIVVGGLGVVVLLLAGKGVAVLAGLVLLALSVAPSAYMLWCLRQNDVQEWMLRRSLNLGDDE